jgi:hypothetical protein
MSIEVAWTGWFARRPQANAGDEATAAASLAVFSLRPAKLFRKRRPNETPSSQTMHGGTDTDDENGGGAKDGWRELFEKSNWYLLDTKITSNALEWTRKRAEHVCSTRGWSSKDERAACWDGCSGRYFEVN